MKPGAGRVFIIGAGPGDPGLVTVRGARLLGEADVIVYDRATEPALRWARPEAERLIAGGAAERETAQDAISMLVAEKARDGHLVARLKWGDPFVFDSGAKEALFLHEQGIPFEVVPGVPAAIGATAYAGVPVTYPGAGDALLLLRGQEDSQNELPDLDWDAVGRLDGTLACHAAGRLVPAVLQKLLDHGVPAETGTALIEHGTLPAQRTTTGTLVSMIDEATHLVLDGPVLVVVGDVTGLRDHLRWFDERPLFGRRIVVTRSQEQAREIIDAIEDFGAQAIQAPTFRLSPPEDSEAVDRAAASVDNYRWVVFESANAVTRFMSALTSGPRDVRAFGDVLVCAVGPSTADRLTAAGIKPDVVMPEFGNETAGALILAKGSVSGARVLVVRPDYLRSLVGEELERSGAIITDLVAYRSAAAPADSPAAQDLYRLLLDGRVDAVTFTSPTAVRRFAALIGEEQAADLLNTTVVAAIGPVTAAAARAMGVERVLVPDTYTVTALVDVLVAHLAHASNPETASRS